MWAGVPATPSFVTPKEEATAGEPFRWETVPKAAPSCAGFMWGTDFMMDICAGSIGAHDLRWKPVRLRPVVAITSSPSLRHADDDTLEQVSPAKLRQGDGQISCE